jgi:hypothetical protein
MDFDLFTEIISYLGMICILAAFLLETRDILGSKDTKYLTLMSLGSGLLAVRALLIYEWAFLVLEIVWCLAAIMALVKKNG